MVNHMVNGEEAMKMTFKTRALVPAVLIVMIFTGCNAQQPGSSISDESRSASSQAVSGGSGSDVSEGSPGSLIPSSGSSLPADSGSTSPTITAALSPVITPPDKDCLQGHIGSDSSGYEIPNPVKPALLDNDATWIRSEKNVLSGFYSMYQPEVIYTEDKEYPYRMWFMGWAQNANNDKQILLDGTVYNGYPGGDAIFLARSKDLDSWQVYSRKQNGTGEQYWDSAEKTADWYPVLTCQDVWYDDFHVGDPSIVYQNGTYFMAYSAMGTDKPDTTYSYVWQDAAYCIMGAVSNDGIHWARSKEPLLIWEGEYGIDENVTRSASNDTYFGMYQRPSLMYENGRWKMWFDYWAGYNSGNGTSIGYAENTEDFLDSSDWDKKTTDTKPLLSQCVDLDVVKINGAYFGYGDPFISAFRVNDPEIKRESAAWSLRQIVEFQSPDGLSWTATGYFRPDTGYPADQIPQVFLDHQQNRVCIFYATQRGTREGGAYDWRWDTLRYMYKKVSDFK